jgi:hypothetical protein
MVTTAFPSKDDCFESRANARTRLNNYCYGNGREPFDVKTDSSANVIWKCKGCRGKFAIHVGSKRVPTDKQNRYGDTINAKRRNGTGVVITKFKKCRCPPANISTYGKLPVVGQEFTLRSAIYFAVKTYCAKHKVPSYAITKTTTANMTMRCFYAESYGCPGSITYHATCNGHGKQRTWGPPFTITESRMCSQHHGSSDNKMEGHKVCKLCLEYQVFESGLYEFAGTKKSHAKCGVFCIQCIAKTAASHLEMTFPNKTIELEESQLYPCPYCRGQFATAVERYNRTVTKSFRPFAVLSGKVIATRESFEFLTPRGLEPYHTAYRNQRIEADRRYAQMLEDEDED